MEFSLFRKSLSLFPIYVERGLNVFIKGKQLKTVDVLTPSRYYLITSKQHKIEALGAGTRLFKKYKDTELSYQEIHLLIDHIKDQVKNNKLDKNYLTDLDSQASYISKTCNCICSVSQLKRYHIQKHPLKQRIKRTKLLKK